MSMGITQMTSGVSRLALADRAAGLGVGSVGPMISEGGSQKGGQQKGDHQQKGGQALISD